MDHLLPFATCLQFGELFGKLVSKGTGNGDLESVQGSQMERERILSELRDIHDFLERKAHQADFLMRCLNLTEENGECKLLMLLFMKLACSSSSTGWNFIRRIN